MFRHLCFLFLLVMPPHPPLLLAKPDLKVSLPSDPINLRQNTELKIQLDWPSGEGRYQFAFPSIGLENLTLERQGESEEIFPRDHASWVRKTFTLELKPQRKGKGQIHGFDLPYENPATGDSGKFSVSPLVIQITSPPLGAGIWLGAGAIGFFIVLAFLTYRKWTRHEATSPRPVRAGAFSPLRKERPETALVNPDEILLAATREFRKFLAEYYRLDAERATEDDLIRLLESQNLPHEELLKLKSLLGRLCELKFVGKASQENPARLHSEILQFVESKRVVGPSGSAS